jgi:hypothetical protein
MIIRSTGRGVARRGSGDAASPFTNLIPYQGVPASEAEHIAAAQVYIDALVSHNAHKVPFATDCTRIEVETRIGFSANHLCRSLNRGPQYLVIRFTSVPEYNSP